MQSKSSYAEELAKVSEFSEFGPVLNSSTRPLPLTEKETEYTVNCVKHIFKEHIVFQVRLFHSFMIPRTYDSVCCI